MTTETRTAREFILATLTAFPDRELQVTDLSIECNDRYTKGNIQLTLGRLLVEGKVVRTVEENRSAWWAIAAPEKR